MFVELLCLGLAVMEIVRPGELLASVRHSLATVKVLILTVHFDNLSLQLKKISCIYGLSCKLLFSFSFSQHWHPQECKEKSEIISQLLSLQSDCLTVRFGSEEEINKLFAGLVKVFKKKNF